MTRCFGWNIAAAAARLMLLSVGMRLGVGPFFLPIAQDLGFSRSLPASAQRRHPSGERQRSSESQYSCSARDV